MDSIDAIKVETRDKTDRDLLIMLYVQNKFIRQEAAELKSQQAELSNKVMKLGNKMDIYGEKCSIYDDYDGQISTLRIGLEKINTKIARYENRFTGGKNVISLFVAVVTLVIVLLGRLYDMGFFKSLV